MLICAVTLNCYVSGGQHRLGENLTARRRVESGDFKAGFCEARNNELVGCISGTPTTFCVGVKETERYFSSE